MGNWSELLVSWCIYGVEIVVSAVIGLRLMTDYVRAVIRKDAAAR